MGVIAACGRSWPGVREARFDRNRTFGRSGAGCLFQTTAAKTAPGIRRCQPRWRNRFRPSLRSVVMGQNLARPTAPASPAELCVLGLLSLFHMLNMGQSRARYDFRRSRFCLSSGTGAAVGAMLVCPSVAATEGLGTRSGSDETHTRFHAVL